MTIAQEERVKSRQEIMNILEAFDLAGSLRGPGELASVPHRTVARYVANRVAGEPVESTWVAGRSPDIALSGSPATPQKTDETPSDLRN